MSLVRPAEPVEPLRLQLVPVAPVTAVVSLDRAAPIHVDDEELEAAIARRNIAWARWQDARTALAIARDEIGFHDLRPYVQVHNAAQDAYEDADRQLFRIRGWWRREREA